MANGRPLRFIGGVVTVWAGARVALLWPAALPLPTLDAAPVAAAEPAIPYAAAMVPPAARRGGLRAPDAQPPGPQPPAAVPSDRSVMTTAGPAANLAVAPTGPTKPAAAERSTARAYQPIVVAPPIVSTPAAASRFRADGWLVARPHDGDALAFGQLGASQGGVRLTYAVDGDRRVALSARVSTPLRGVGGETGIGIDVQPTRLPVHILIEERVGLDGGGAQPAAVMITGMSAALPGPMRIDAYAQGGAVARRGRFAEAAAVVTRVLAVRGHARLELGAGTWGAAQRGIARLDVGPSIALVTPGEGRILRLQLDYRARIAGHARPGSGPALTLGGSF